MRNTLYPVVSKNHIYSNKSQRLSSHHFNTQSIVVNQSYGKVQAKQQKKCLSDKRLASSTALNSERPYNTQESPYLKQSEVARSYAILDSVNKTWVHLPSNLNAVSENSKKF